MTVSVRSAWGFIPFPEWAATSPFLNHSSRVDYPDDKAQIEAIVPDYEGKPGPPWIVTTTSTGNST